MDLAITDNEKSRPLNKEISKIGDGVLVCQITNMVIDRAQINNRTDLYIIDQSNGLVIPIRNRTNVVDDSTAPSQSNLSGTPPMDI